jgi:hypothetical protein
LSREFCNFIPPYSISDKLIKGWCRPIVPSID